ncbi:hypothetical protein MUP77_08430 [Candidatus Bathyarchaeota archaeon]|nr:hypothetical protein [Candidatus Bathyarchaeota archaeon]
MAEGYRHTLRVVGSPEFKRKVREIVVFIKLAGYDDFLRTYIRKISEVNGISQLREADAAVWLNHYILENPFEGTRFVFQKIEQMKAYLTGDLYYIKGETSAVEKSIDFLEKLKDNLQDEALKKRCDAVWKQWKEARIV